MIAPQSLAALEFEKVLAAFAAFAHGEPSRGGIMGIRPFEEAAPALERLAQVEQIRRLIQTGSPLNIHSYEDVLPTLAALRPQGAVAEARELLVFLPVLSSVESLRGALGEAGGPLEPITMSLGEHSQLARSIERSIDDEGNIMDSASYELAELRRSLRAIERRISGRLEELTRSAELTPFLQDNFITKRSGRWVIPVRMDSKGMVAGVVHDVSRTGETAFVEPLEVIGLSNELENMAAEVKAEEIRILRSLSSRLRADSDAIAASYRAMVTLDMLNALALGAERHRLESPRIEGSDLELIKARHPLLAMNPGAKVVPLDARLGDSAGARIMLITGPNAGGKTIAIKTVGLLAIMAQSGIAVPADGASRFPVFSNILVDIGDEQSIENMLSTFSAHISNIASIVKSSGTGCLVLMDELGTGTDPSQGAAIGAGVLRHLLAKGSLALATTHLIDIVAYVHETSGMTNASMEFDEATMTPLYRLVPGEPGQSRAIETAERFGLPAEVIEFARERAGNIQLEFERLLGSLKETRAAHEAAIRALEGGRREIEAMRAELERSRQELEERQRQLMKGSYEEAAAIVSEARREVHRLMDEAKKDKARESLKELDKKQAAIKEALQAFSPPPEVDIASLSPGDTVKLRSGGLRAQVLSVDEKRSRLRVKAGAKELEVAINDISHAEAAGKKQPRTPVHYIERPESAPLEINLIGKRVEEALDLLEPFINQASLAGLSEVRIIHGIGTGALKNAVREALRDHPLVSESRPGERHEGGGGATVARLKQS